MSIAAFVLSLFSRMPTEAQIDAAPGLIEDRLIEERRIIASVPLFSDAQIDAAPDHIPDQPIRHGWLQGDFNIPTDDEVDAHAAWRQRTYYARCCRALVQSYSSGELIIDSDWRIINLDAFNPMPEAQNLQEALMQARAAAAFSQHVNMLVILNER